MEYFQKIVGKKCYLAPLEVEHALLLARWNNDPEVSVNTGDIAEVISVAQQREYIEHIITSGYGFLIVALDGDIPIGFCKLARVDMIHRNATLGIVIGEKSYQNKGMGTETVSLLLNFGFNIVNLNNIMLKVFSFNERAINVYRKCGFKEFGRRRKCVIFGDKKYDDVYMDILADEYREGNYGSNCG